MTRPRPIPPERNTKSSPQNARTGATDGNGSTRGSGGATGNGSETAPPLPSSLARASRVAMARRSAGSEVEPPPAPAHEANLDYGDRPPASIALIEAGRVDRGSTTTGGVQKLDPKNPEQADDLVPDDDDLDDIDVDFERDDPERDHRKPDVLERDDRKRDNFERDNFARDNFARDNGQHDHLEHGDQHTISRDVSDHAVIEDEVIDRKATDLNRLERLADVDRAPATHEPPASVFGNHRGRPEIPRGSDRSRPERSAISLQRRRVVAAVFFAWMMVVVGMIAGFLLAEAQPDQWGAEAEVVLEPRSSQIDRFLATEVVWIASSTVIDRAAATVGLDRKYINENLEVSTIADSTAIGVQFVDEDPDVAIQVVSAVVDSYLADVRNQQLNTTRDVYSARIDELRAARAAIEVDLAAVERSNAAAEEAGQAVPFPTEQRRMALESEELLGQISGLEEQVILADIEILSQAKATVVTPAHLLDERVAPTPITFAALGALVAGALAAATIFLVGRRRSQASRGG